MTKKHYIALADALRRTRPSNMRHIGQWRADCIAVADTCAAHNPNFNRERWFGYLDGKCGPGGGPVKTGGSDDGTNDSSGPGTPGG